MINRKSFNTLEKGLSLVGILVLLAAPAWADGAKTPIKIGSMAPFASQAFFADPFDHGVALAVEEINAKGGVLGRPLEILKRDTKMSPAEAVRLADELRTRDKVDALINADSSGATLAISAWAHQNNIPLMVAGSEADSIIWEQYNPEMARVDASGYAWVSGSLEKAIALYGDRLQGKKWASVAPNFEFGRSLVQSAKAIAAARHLNATWVTEQWPTFDKMDAGATVAALKRADPAIVFCTLFGTDLVKFVREAKKRGFDTGRLFIAPPIAFPEHLEMLGAELPQGWISVGAPFNEIKTPTFVAFKDQYEATFHAPLRTYALSGYSGVYALAAAIQKAGTLDARQIAKSFDNLRFDTPTGPQTIRSIDHQARAPFWVGETALVDGKPQLVHWSTYNIADHLPSDQTIQALRANSQNPAEKKGTP